MKYEDLLRLLDSNRCLEAWMAGKLPIKDESLDNISLSGDNELSEDDKGVALQFLEALKIFKNSAKTAEARKKLQGERMEWNSVRLMLEREKGKPSPSAVGSACPCLEDELIPDYSTVASIWFAEKLLEESQERSAKSSWCCCIQM